MTQAIGLASAVALLAFLLVLYALVNVSVRRFLEGDSEAARGPMFLSGILIVVAFISLFTWASSAVGNATESVGWAAGSVAQLVAGFPYSLICLGPLFLVVIFTLATPGARRWIGGNYFPVSIVILAIFFLALIIYLILQVFGGWGVLALLVLIGLILGLGTRGLVFVPELGDGPRLGENQASSMLRITGTKARRNVLSASGFVFSLPTRIVSKQGAPVVGVIVVIALGGWWFSGRSQSEANRPVAVVVLSTPTPVSASLGTLTSQAASTPTPGVTVLKVANTGGQGVLMRDQPGRSGKPLATLPEGSSLDIAGPEQVVDGAAWRQVKEKGGKVGWVSTQYLEVEKVFGLVRVANTGAEGVILRAGATKTQKIVVVLKEGTELKVIGEDVKADGVTWRNVKDEKGNVGWASSQFLAPIP